MSDVDNLRDRIARALRTHSVSEPRGGTATEGWCDCTCGLRITVLNGSRDEAWRRGRSHQAQAIINEFELTVETRNDGCTACGEPPESRILGKWVEQ